MGAVEIRLAAVADVEVIHSVLARAFAEYRSLYTSGGFEATVLSDEEIGTRIREGPVWVAAVDGA